MMTTLKLTEFEPFGVEVDLDLSKELDDATKRELADLLWHRHLLRFRDQTFSFEQQVDLMRLFGPISRTEGDINSRDYVSKDEKFGANLGSGRLAFHQDLAHSPIPMIALSLFGLDVEENTTSTAFIDSTLVYNQLPQDLRDRLDGLEALHVYPTRDGKNGEHLRSTSPGGSAVDIRFPNAVHPAVISHPHSSQPILFVNEMMTDRIVGVRDQESEEILAALCEATYQPENIYEHWWNVGDLILWDNMAVQHGRPDQAQTGRRTLRRVVCAEKSVYEQHPQMTYVNGRAVLTEYA
jgi:taurine dioxygenase